MLQATPMRLLLLLLPPLPTPPPLLLPLPSTIGCGRCRLCRPCGMLQGVGANLGTEIQLRKAGTGPPPPLLYVPIIHSPPPPTHTHTHARAQFGCILAAARGAFEAGASGAGVLFVVRITGVFRTSRVTLHVSCVTPHTSHLTPHTSHPTPHTSHLVHNTSHLFMYPLLQHAALGELQHLAARLQVARDVRRVSRASCDRPPGTRRGQLQRAARCVTPAVQRDGVWGVRYGVWGVGCCV